MSKRGEGLRLAPRGRRAAVGLCESAQPPSHRDTETSAMCAKFEQSGSCESAQPPSHRDTAHETSAMCAKFEESGLCDSAQTPSHRDTETSAILPLRAASASGRCTEDRGVYQASAIPQCTHRSSGPWSAQALAGNLPSRKCPNPLNLDFTLDTKLCSRCAEEPPVSAQLGYKP